MKRLLVFLGLLLFLAAPAGAGAAVLKIATLSPEGSAWMNHMREGAKEIEQKTQGRVRFQFYPGGVMGNDQAVLRKIRIGQLHGGALTAGSLSDASPDNRLLSLPLMFRSQEEVDHVRKALDPFILKKLEENGFVCFGLAGGGFAYFMGKNPVRSVEDLRAQKVWIPENDQTGTAALEAIGVTPVPLPISDVRAGLTTGLIDTVAISPLGALALQWHTHARYMTGTPLMYLYGILAISDRAFGRLSPEDQKTVRDVMGEIFLTMDKENLVSDRNAMDALKNQGIQVSTPREEVQRGWYDLAPQVAERLVNQGSLSAESLKMLNSLLDEYRNTPKSAHE